MSDIVGEKLIYDAPTAQGGSGGPVFNSNGEAIAVNAAYIDGFTGGTIGITTESLKPLLAECHAESRIRQLAFGLPAKPADPARFPQMLFFEPAHTRRKNLRAAEIADHFFRIIPGDYREPSKAMAQHAIGCLVQRLVRIGHHRLA